MKYLFFLICGLMVCAAASAQTYSNANLNGTYSLQVTNPVYDSWSRNVPCPTNPSITAFGGGSTTTTSMSYGTVNFDGAGNLNTTYTNIGQINQAASNNTVQIKFNSQCQVISNNGGHIVYIAPATQTQSGTYSVQTNGTGTILLTGSTNPLLFQLAGTNGSGISTTVLMNNTQVNGQSISFGIAVHQ